MNKYLLVLSLTFSSYLFADYATYQEAQQTLDIKSLYSKARNVAIDLEKKYNKVLSENEQLKKEVQTLKESNLKLQIELEKYKNKENNSSKEGATN